MHCLVISFGTSHPHNLAPSLYFANDLHRNISLNVMVWKESPSMTIALFGSRKLTHRRIVPCFFCTTTRCTKNMTNSWAMILRMALAAPSTNCTLLQMPVMAVRCWLPGLSGNALAATLVAVRRSTCTTNEQHMPMSSAGVHGFH